MKYFTIKRTSVCEYNEYRELVVDEDLVLDINEYVNERMVGDHVTITMEMVHAALELYHSDEAQAFREQLETDYNFRYIWDENRTYSEDLRTVILNYIDDMIYELDYDSEYIDTMETEDEIEVIND